MPWPLDSRLAGGHLDLAGLAVPDSATLIRNSLPILAEHSAGFSTLGAIYLPFDGPLDPDSLPASAMASLEPEASLFLVNVDPGSPDYAQRTPIECRFMAEAATYTPANLLACVPFPGFPLRGNAVHALIATDALRAADGGPVSATRTFRALRDADPGDDPTLEALVQVYAPLGDFAAAEDLALEEVVAATVFTTQEPTTGLRAIAAHTETLPLPELLAGTLAPYAFAPEPPSAGYDALQARLHASVYQQGETPFRSAGGEIRFDADGQPVVAGQLEMQLGLSVPNDRPMPANGWPVVLYHHGTGGDAFSFIDDGTARTLAAAGLAMLGADAPVHGLRRPAGEDPTFLFFNIQNFLAMRENIRQGAADLLLLKRFAAALVVDAADSPTGAEVRFDPANIYFMGHSQGGLTGPLLLAVSDGVRGAMLSGAGGSIIPSILYKQTPVSLRDLAETLLGLPAGEALDAFHPLLAIVQAFTDPVDSANYAPLLYRWGAGRNVDVWLTQGLLDTDVPPPITDALVTALGASPIAPLHQPVPGLELRGIAPISAPATANLQGADGLQHSALYSQYPDGNHFVVQDDPGAQAQLGHWFSSLVEAGHGELLAPPP